MRIIFYTLTVLLFAAVGCSKSPKSYNNRIETNVTPAAPGLPGALNVGGQEKPSVTVITTPGLGGENNVGGAEFDAKVKFNSNQPIVYSIGAGGVAYNTTLTEAETILAAPRVPPNNAGETQYDEGLYIRWRIDEPRSPDFIIVLSSYLGKIQLPSPLAPIGINHDFSKQYAPNSKTAAEKFARDYYNIFEEEDASYDCIATNRCQLIWGTAEQKNFIASLPGMTFLISKDRMVLFRVMIIPQVPLGILANNLDMLSGQFLVPNEAPIAIGNDFLNIEQRWTASVDANNKFLPLTKVNESTFGRGYGNAYLIFNKTQFDRKDVQPLENDKLKAVQVYGDWPNALTFGGNPVFVYESPTEIAVSTVQDPLALSTPPAADVQEKILQLNMQIQPALVKSFAEKLLTVVKGGAQLAYPASEVTTHFSGKFQKKTIKDYTAYVTAYDKLINRGVFIQYSLSEESGSFSSIYITELGGNAFDTVVMPEFQTPVAKVAGQTRFTELSGFKIGEGGQKVVVTDWDLGRNEATINIQGTNITARGTYVDKDVEAFAYSTEKTTMVDLASVYVSSLNVSLGLKLESETATERVYKVVVVRSSLKASTVQGLCGGKFNPAFGIKDTEFLTQLAATPGCNYLREDDTGGNKFLVNAYFPDDGIRLTFSDAELVMTTVYAPLSEVQ